MGVLLEGKEDYVIFTNRITKLKAIPRFPSEETHMKEFYMFFFNLHIYNIYHFIYTCKFTFHDYRKYIISLEILLSYSNLNYPETLLFNI